MTEQVTERTGDSLCSLVDLWDNVSHTLGITVKQAADFVEQKFDANKSVLWTEDEYTGLWKPCNDNHSYLLDAWNAGEKNNWTGGYIFEWKFLKMTPKEFQAIMDAATRIKELSHAEQDTSSTPAQDGTVMQSNGMDEILGLAKEQKRNVDRMIGLLSIPEDLASDGLSAAAFLDILKLDPNADMDMVKKYRARFEKLCKAFPHVSAECLKMLGIAYASIDMFFMEELSELSIRNGAMHLMNSSMALGAATALLPTSVGYLSAKVQLEHKAMLSKAGLQGAESRNKPYEALKNWALEKAGGMRGADMDIARKLSADLPNHLADISGNATRLIYDTLRAQKKPN